MEPANGVRPGKGSGNSDPRHRGFPVGRALGVEIRLDPSVIIVFVLIVYSLGAGVFPEWHPGWGPLLVWGTAAAAGVLFLLSVLAHELAHSVVARSRKIPVPRITLFVFGGMSEMSQEPEDPRTEFLVAVVGPLTSIGLGIGFLLLGLALSGYDMGSASPSAVQDAVSGFGPLPTLLVWLGPINLMLGVFNLVPGFPLDGGRVLRSFLWATTGDLERSTRWASRAGQGVSWLLMAWGVLRILGGGFVGGLWLILIGWFLGNAARTAYSQLLVRRVLEGLTARDLMRTRFGTADPDQPLIEFVENRFLRASQPAWPVVDEGRLVGIVTLESLRSVDAAADGHRVRDAMAPVEDALDPDTGGEEALRVLVATQQDPLPVVRSGEVVGLLHRGDIMRWLALKELQERERR